MTAKKKVGIFLSHPIQYFSPLFKFLEQESDRIDLHVFYFSDFSLKQYEDVEFHQKIKWDIPLLDGYKYTFLKNSLQSRWTNRFLSFINVDILKTIKQHKFDLVITFGWAYLSNFLVYFGARMSRTKFGIRSESPAIYERKKQGLKKWIRKTILKSMFKHTDAFFYIGRQNKEFYQLFGVPNNKLFFTPYCVDNQEWMLQTKSVNILSERRKYNISKDAIVFGFCGKLIPRKQPDLLLKAFHKVNGKDCHLMIAGAGNMENQLKEYVLQHQVKNVHFLGFVNQSAIKKLYVISDVFVLPSIYETWGLVVNEAMCCGNAVIVADQVGCSYDLVNPKKNGRIFNTGNLNSLIEQLDFYIKSPTKIKDHKLASEKIMESWDFKNILKGIETYLETEK